MARVEQIGRFAGQGPGAKSIASLVFLALAALILAGFFYTGVDSIEPEEAAVIVKNVGRKQIVQTTPGLVFHLPFGMTEVHKFDTRKRILELAGQSDRAVDEGVAAVTVKTRDGSNVTVNAQIIYRVNRTEEGLRKLAGAFGGDPALGKVTQVILAFARSDIREILGELYIYEITQASERQEKTLSIQDKMNKELADLGIAVDQVSIVGLDLNNDYETLIKTRKDADQTLANQGSAQMTAMQQQAQQVAAAMREKNNAIEKERGEQGKRIIQAEGEAAQLKARADGEAVRARIEGDRAFLVAQNDAKAIEAEGLAKAEGVRKLAEAYEKGGMALVREALAAQYAGRTINGRPYTHSDKVERLSLENAAAAAKTSAKGGTE